MAEIRDNHVLSLLWGAFQMQALFLNSNPTILIMATSISHLNS